MGWERASIAKGTQVMVVGPALAQADCTAMEIVADDGCHVQLGFTLLSFADVTANMARRDRGGRAFGVLRLGCQ